MAINYGKIAINAISAGAGGIVGGIVDSVLPQISSNATTNQIIKSLGISVLGAFMQSQKSESLKFAGAGAIGVAFERLFQKGFGFNFRVGLTEDQTKLLVSEDEMEQARMVTNQLSMETAFDTLDKQLANLAVNSDDTAAFQVANSQQEAEMLRNLSTIAASML